MVMCRQPTIRAPFSGFFAPYSFRSAMRPGISVSAMLISLRPQSASLISATLKSSAISEGSLQRGGNVGLFPREATIRFRRAAKMAVGYGARVDRLVEGELRANAARAEIDHVLDDLGELLLVNLAGAVGVDIDRQRLRDAD